MNEVLLPGTSFLLPVVQLPDSIISFTGSNKNTKEEYKTKR